MEIAEKQKKKTWNKGINYSWSDERRKKFDMSTNKYKHSEETKEKIKNANTDKLRKLAETKRGIKRDPSIGRKISQSKKGIAYFSGETHWNWKGGISKNPYPKQFNNFLKLKIRTRDNFTCCICGRMEQEELEELNQKLCVNHIDFNKNNCNESNLNTLCLRCNVKINREREYWTNYFQQYGYE